MCALLSKVGSRVTSRTSDFAGTELATWPTLSPSGSWTHTTDIATVSSPGNVVETVDGNQRGRSRVAAATTVASKRSHHADFTNYKFASAEVRVYVHSRAGTANTPSICLSLHTASTAANSDRYEARFGLDGDGKEAGAYLTKVVGGVTTTIFTTTVDGGFTTPRYYAFRAVKRSADVLLQFIDSASPITDWSAAHTHADSTTGLWDAVGGVAIGELYEADPTAQTTVYYDDFAATDIQPILPSGIASTATVGSPSVAGRYTISVSGIASGVVVGTPTVMPGPVTISPLGLSSSAVLGAPTVTPGAAQLAPAGISPTLVVGTPTVGASLTQHTSPSSIAPTATVGTVFLALLSAVGSPFSVEFRERTMELLAEARKTALDERPAELLADARKTRLAEGATVKIR